MGNAFGLSVTEALPNEAWSELSSRQTAFLVDVRTKEEWTFVGVPDLASLGKQTIFIEWQEYPNMSYNPSFVDMLMEEIGSKPVDKIFFLCRSGVRSMEAANALSNHLRNSGKNIRCVNVAEGFEGDMNLEKHRGCSSGWKARDLAWRQY
jgi:rhodanese-related sulfurtransferase|tara:strand:- start:8944 stop:9393 length:450 start_codon:yes stop_codon:yes gene_type:complete